MRNTVPDHQDMSAALQTISGWQVGSAPHREGPQLAANSSTAQSQDGDAGHCRVGPTGRPVIPCVHTPPRPAAATAGQPARRSRKPPGPVWGRAPATDSTDNVKAFSGGDGAAQPHAPPAHGAAAPWPRKCDTACALACRKGRLRGAWARRALVLRMPRRSALMRCRQRRRQ
jgi:hypothetical protein